VYIRLVILSTVGHFRFRFSPIEKLAVICVLQRCQHAKHLNRLNRADNFKILKLHARTR